MTAGGAGRPARYGRAMALTPRRPRGVPLAALLLCAGLAGCGSGAAKGAAGQAGGGSATASGGPVQQLTVHAGPGLSFAETHLAANTGRLQLTLQVRGSTPHNLMFADGPAGGTPTVQDARASVTLTFSRPGTYHFLCTIHPAMTGTLVVS